MAGNTFNEAGRNSPSITFRVPNGLSERLKAEAIQNRRSLSAEIISRLESSFDIKQQIIPAIADLLEQHVQNEVNVRLKAIADKIGGAA